MRARSEVQTLRGLPGRDAYDFPSSARPQRRLVFAATDDSTVSSDIS